jgi:hypothetical protein
MNDRLQISLRACMEEVNGIPRFPLIMLLAITGLSTLFRWGRVRRHIDNGWEGQEKLLAYLLARRA